MSWPPQNQGFTSCLLVTPPKRESLEESMSSQDQRSSIQKDDDINDIYRSLVQDEEWQEASNQTQRLSL